jgi:phosphoenolpyruvate-protein phosphotransferase (PTS system enzyme I)
MPKTRILQGVGVSGGIAIGRAVCIETRGPEIYRLHVLDEQVEIEVGRLHEGVRHARGELERIRCRADERLGNDLAAIFDAHILLLSDPHFLGRVEERIRTHKVNAEWAVARTAEELDNHFARIDDVYLRERSQDLTDVSRHLVRSLQGIAHHELSDLPEDVVIVADDLTPADAIRLGRERVIGFAMEGGGRTSHTAIIARSLNLPAVAGLLGVVGMLEDESPIVIDGESGTVILHPGPEVLDQYRRRKAEMERRSLDLLATRELQAVTLDGVEIQLMANIDLPEEVEEVGCYGAAGVGLYRSEFLYIEKSPSLPTEEEHIAIYRRLIELAAPHPAVVRTYDLGGRKLAREMMETEEENPVLGLRGIRLTLARPEVFRTQIRALYRAALHGNLWVMLPLVSTIDEVRRFRAFVEEVMGEMEREGVAFRRDVPLGVMIEVPAAAIIADVLARDVDFFSVGTNDLIQYSLAVDRNNDHVAALYQPLHPAILRMLRFVVDSANAAGIDVGLCGEMASDPRHALLLVGLGLRRLSMSPRRIPEIKHWIREMAATDLARLATSCLEHSTAEEVQRHLDELFECTLSPEAGSL